MQFENHNSFCASCHTEGEQTFYDRSTASDPVDLASIHDIKGQARCIDCHTGPGIIGRYGGLMAGSTDLINFFSGHYPQPAALEEPYPDANCLKCHADIFQKQEFNNHFHVFLPRWQAIDKNAATCVSCHPSHDITGDAKIGFLNEQQPPFVRSVIRSPADKKSPTFCGAFFIIPLPAMPLPSSHAIAQPIGQCS